MLRLARLIPVLLFVLVHAGCLQDLDPEGLVRDLRILGIRAEPAELVDDALPSSVRFEALVLDPRSPDPFSVELEWQFCPVESELFCRDYEDLVGSFADGFAIDAFSLGGSSGATALSIPGFPNCPASAATLQGLATVGAIFGAMAAPDYLGRYREVVTGDTFSLDVGGALQSVDLGFLDSVSQDLIACGEPSPSFALPQETSDLHLYHFATNPLQSLLGVWPTVVLTARANGEVLTGQKRLPVVFRHPANPLLLLRTLAPELDLGINICPPVVSAVTGGAAAATDCLPVEVHTPNRNPEFAAIRIRDGRGSTGGPYDTFWTPADGPDPMLLEPRQVKVFESIRIDPVFTDDSEESFQRFTVASGSLEVSTLEDKEELSVGWFATAGGFRDQTTFVRGTIGLDTALDFADEPGLVRVFMVARDQRGGISWKGFRVEVVQ